MAQRTVTLGIVVLAGAGITLLWPTPTLAAAATSDSYGPRANDAPPANLSAAPAAESAAPVRTDLDAASFAVGVAITGPAECVRQLAQPLRDAYQGALDFTCSSDTAALQAVAKGRADAAVVSVAFEQQLPDANLREFKLGDFVVALVRHDENPVCDISRAQLDQLCRGRARGWQDLGGRGSELRAFSTFSGPGDEARAFGTAQGLSAARERGLLADEVIARVQRDRAGLGVVAVREVADGVACLAIDGVLPSANAFAAGSYPFGYRLRLVYRADHRAPMAALLRFLSGPDGQRALGR